MSSKTNISSKIKQLLQDVRFASMATVNEDGSPHNTPFLFLYDENFHRIYWGSHPQSIHSKNIARSGNLFITLYDSHTYRTGLYIEAIDGKIAENEELESALKIHNQFRAKQAKPAIPISYYLEGPQKMYFANVKNIWTNDRELDDSGHLIREFRKQIQYP